MAAKAFTTAEDAARYLGMAAPDAHLPVIVAAVNDLLTGWTWLDSASGQVRLGATMLAARLHRRRNSPGGIEQLADGGIAYTARTDPDIARFLGIESHAAPQIG